MVIPPPRRSRLSAACPHTAPTATARWSSIRVATPSLSSVSTRMVFLLHGEDSFRTRLRLGELVAALLSGAPTGATDLSTLAEPHLGTLLGVTRRAHRAARAGRRAGLDLGSRAPARSQAPARRGGHARLGCGR